MKDSLFMGVVPATICTEVRSVIPLTIFTSCTYDFDKDALISHIVNKTFS